MLIPTLWNCLHELLILKTAINLLRVNSKHSIHLSCILALVSHSMIHALKIIPSSFWVIPFLVDDPTFFKTVCCQQSSSFQALTVILHCDRLAHLPCSRIFPPSPFCFRHFVSYPVVPNTVHKFSGNKVPLQYVSQSNANQSNVIYSPIYVLFIVRVATLGDNLGIVVENVLDFKLTVAYSKVAVIQDL